MNHRKRPSSIRSSAATIGGNDDLLMEILLCLPAKSLVRFKLVSKHWRSLISAYSFSHLHTFVHRHCPQHSFLLRANTSQFFVCDPTIKTLIPFHFGFPYVKILQSCNGLLLLQCKSSPNGHKDYYIFNPTKAKVKSYLTCESWRRFYFDEEVHFVRYPPFSFGFIPHRRRVHSTDEKIKSYTIEFNGYWRHLRLCLMPEKNRFRVYKTKDIERGWPKKYSGVDFNPISATFSGRSGRAIELLGMIRGETRKNSMLLFHVPGKIMIYRFRDKVFDVLVDFTGEDYFEEDRLQFQFDDAHQFVYSLAPV